LIQRAYKEIFCHALQKLTLHFPEQSRNLSHSQTATEKIVSTNIKNIYQRDYSVIFSPAMKVLSKI